MLSGQLLRNDKVVTFDEQMKWVKELAPCWRKVEIFLEWPTNAVKGWGSHAISRLVKKAKELNRPLYWCRFHGCAYGLEYQGVPVLKAWTVLTSNRKEWTALQHSCPGHQDHLQCRGPVVQASACYPTKMVQAIAKAVISSWNEMETSHLDRMFKHICFKSMPMSSTRRWIWRVRNLTFLHWVGTAFLQNLHPGQSWQLSDKWCSGFIGHQGALLWQVWKRCCRWEGLRNGHSRWLRICSVQIALNQRSHIQRLLRCWKKLQLCFSKLELTFSRLSMRMWRTMAAPQTWRPRSFCGEIGLAVLQW